MQKRPRASLVCFRTLELHAHIKNHIHAKNCWLLVGLIRLFNHRSRVFSSPVELLHWYYYYFSLMFGIFGKRTDIFCTGSMLL